MFEPISLLSVPSKVVEHLLSNQINSLETWLLLHVSDSKLTWNTHTWKLAKAFSGKVKKLNDMRYFSKQTLETVYFKGILPSVLYGIPLWGKCASQQINSIEKVHLRAKKNYVMINKYIHTIFMHLMIHVRKALCSFKQRIWNNILFKFYIWPFNPSI